MFIALVQLGGLLADVSTLPLRTLWALLELRSATCCSTAVGVELRVCGENVLRVSSDPRLVI